MDGIREYLLSVCGAAILCAMVSGIMGKKGMIGSAGKMLTGIFMLVTLLSPLLELRLSTLDGILADVQAEADTLTVQGENSARQEMEAIIKEQAEAYILDKAKSFDATLTVSVTLGGDDVPVPQSVQLTGRISPYGKQRITDIIAQDLGIPAEAQRWN